MRPKVLIINPWVYDFAAFDLWARPLGVLYLSAWLRRAGFDPRLVDCLDRLHPASEAPAGKSAWPSGTGQWLRQTVPTPAPLQGTPRRFARYGLPESVFIREISAGPSPEVILVTSSMTYWYPGVHLAIALARQAWPRTPIILGGTYATLCREHALARSGADLVVSGPGETGLLQAVKELTGRPVGAGAPADQDPSLALMHLWPDLDLYPRLDFAPLLTSRGCPRRCPYCASGTMYDGYHQRSPEEVLAEIEDRHLRLGLTDFTFFDDALLIGAQDHLLPILEEVVRKGWRLRFHAPNGLHVGLISAEAAGLMRAAGFQTLRLGLESLVPDRQEALGRKVPTGNFETAMGNLQKAGFGADQYRRVHSLRPAGAASGGNPGHGQAGSGSRGQAVPGRVFPPARHSHVAGGRGSVGFRSGWRAALSQQFLLSLPGAGFFLEQALGDKAGGQGMKGGEAVAGGGL